MYCNVYLEITRFSSFAPYPALELAAGLEDHDGADAVVGNEHVAVFVNGDGNGLDEVVVGEGADGAALQAHLSHGLRPPVHLNSRSG